MTRAPAAKPPRTGGSHSLWSWSLGLLVAAMAFEIATLGLTDADGESHWAAFENRVHLVSIALALSGSATWLIARGANPLWSVLMLLPGFSNFVPPEIRDQDEDSE